MKFYSDFAKSVFRSKYLHAGEESAEEAAQRVDSALSKYDSSLKRRIFYFLSNQLLLPAGGIWRAAGSTERNISYVNCTTLDDVTDSLEGIFTSLYWWAKFAAFGQGEGIDISKLRPQGARLRNTAGKSSGGNSFIPVYDTVLKTIAQHGRRGASLISIHDTYPDFEQFCDAKQRDGDIETANLSIQITDKFMQAVKDDAEWILKWQSEEDEDFVVQKKRRAKALFEKMVQAAWKTGDPGVLYIDSIRKNSNSDVLGYPVTSTNACSEVPSDPHNTCILSSINLIKLYEMHPLDFYARLEDLVNFGIRMLDAVIEAEYAEKRSPSAVQRDKLRAIPRIGLGITGFADYLISKKIVYGSKESIREIERIGQIMAQISYITSYEIAKKKGSFAAYNKKKYLKSNYVRRIMDMGLIQDRHLDYQRHVCKLSVAPTGTLSIIANCGGSGIEPIFSKYMVRRERATTGSWKEWFVFNQAVERELKKEGKAVSKSNADQLNEPYWITAYNVSNDDKMILISALQRYIDQGISVTYNLPQNATKKDVANIFKKSWLFGLKGASVYREGSKKGSILITESNYDKSKRAKKRVVEERPKKLPGKVFKRSGYTAVIGFKDGKPYEIFGGNEKNAFEDADIVKVANGDYRLGGINLLSVFTDDMICAITRLTSLSLRHHVPLQFVVETLKKQGTIVGITSFFAGMLSKYLLNEEMLSDKVCPNCGSSQLKYESGCVVCVKCGWSACS